MPSWAPLALFALACPVGMGLMMFFMMRGRHQGKMADHKEAVSPEERLARLEAEKRALEQQLRGGGKGNVAEMTAGSPEGKKPLGN